ncbi:alpha-2-macroglobulin [Novosphingobium umbonatum]|uniref:Alpha-2-macroglobulin n=1 Tax=Novosphingobium umbonatum TaxID=1908524 RepID=A0A3S2VU87_9SPHN|nr:alpha-2-macroglobulin [Novosphingobium umbonatum]
MLVMLLSLPLVARGDGLPHVTQATPGGSGENSGLIERFTLRFSEAMVPLGDPRAQAPATSDCTTKSSGHWVDQQTYVLDFDHALPGGLSCKVQLRKGLTTLRKQALSGQSVWAIDTGGPGVRAVMAPGEDGDTIDEDQVFLVATNVPADPASIAAKAGCALSGLGEMAAVDVLPAETVGQILDRMDKDDWRQSDFLQKAEIGDKLPSEPRLRAAALAKLTALRCRRPLVPQHDMSLVWPAGISDAHGKLAGLDQRFDFKVRAAFEARWECSRANGNAACSPITAATLSFTSPVDRRMALAARLTLADGSVRLPHVRDTDKSALEVDTIRFDGPFPALSRATLTLPADLHDLSGRRLSNAARFPLPVKFAAEPPLVKFAAPFGIIEASDPVLPVTVRAVEPALGGKITSIAGQSTRLANDDAKIAAWLRKLEEAENSDYTKVNEGKPNERLINHTRDRALLGPASPTGPIKPISLPLPGKGRDFEVVGIPLAGRGFHIVEYASPVLGAALLGRPAPRYVATGALVTDMAVHFKWGRESSLVWVTSLSSGRPVAGALVRVSDSCTGRQMAQGSTDAHGLFSIGPVLPNPGIGGGCKDSSDHPVMVSARANGDMSFTLSTWNEGISPYDFDLSFGRDDSGEIIHTLFDRTLVRVGETLHFKHILRRKVGNGFAFAEGVKGNLVLRHMGSETSFTLPLSIGVAGFGEGAWKVPQGAPLGDYALEFEVEGRSFATEQTFRVDEYKLPTMRASITPVSSAREALVQPSSVPLSLFVAYLSGGGAGRLPVTLRTDFNDWSPTPKGWDSYNFGGDPIVEGTRPMGGSGEGQAKPLPFAQVLPVTLGPDGTARADVGVGEKITRPISMSVEMDYPDANGDTMTAGRRLSLYPAAVQLGIKTDDWLMHADDLRLQSVLLDLDGRPVAGGKITIELYSREILTARRRLIGVFYAYDNQEKVTRLDGQCAISTDAQGRASCRIVPDVSGEVTVVARAKDAAGRETMAVTTVWLAGKDEWWFGGDNGDRMDVIPEKPAYASGETARFQVRMPFRSATALVTVEREGVLSSFVTELSGTDPVVEVPMPAAYAPNVYVSVMAVRGRVTGWRAWLAELVEQWGKVLNIQPVTSTVDLAKPAYRLGLAKVQVGWEGHRLDVKVQPERERYGVRDKAEVAVSVHRPDGAPAGGADVAFVAVDEALLQLMPNPSWQALDAMMGMRSLEVATSTAQMQVVGKRHYGKKAVAAGGGGGDASGVNRENFQPVLLWKGHVPLDAQGMGHVSVPLSDSLSRFRLVAVASDGAQWFGTGEATVRTAQDLSIYSGLPEMVRTGDHYDAVFTVKNGTDHPMKVTATASLDQRGSRLAPITVQLAAGAAQSLRWPVDVPAQAGAVVWKVQAQSDSGASDRLEIRQTITPAVPVEVWAASLQQAGSPPMAITPPTGALEGGYVTVSLTDSLAAPLDGVRRYMREYPWNCFEQRLSRLVATGDGGAWAPLAASLPTYLDGDGLLRYWPDSNAKGSTELTAYVLSMTSAAGLAVPEPARGRMVEALRRVVEGRLTAERAIRTDERLVRIAALSALARAGAADPALVARIDMVPAAMPTSTLAQWIVALDRLPRAPRAGALRAAAEGELRRRLVWAGTRLDLADAARAPWWMMVSGDEMAALALDAVMGKADWAQEVPRMMTGFAARQMRGHWDSTPANAWGAVVRRRFAMAYPASAVAGTTRVALAGKTVTMAWPAASNAEPLRLPLAKGALTLGHTGGAAPWAVVSVHAAVPVTQPLSVGYRLSRQVTVVSARDPAHLSQGDVLRIRLTIEAQADRNWVVLADPLPPGASVMSGLGGQSQILRKEEGTQTSGAWPSYTENGRDSWRAYFAWLPRGKTSVDYTVRLNAAGRFTLPAARVEAMYAPDIQAQLPIAPMVIAGR